jgi:hypothetical protein
MRLVVAALIAACGLLAVPAGAAKDFDPGGLRVCGRDRCVPLVDKSLLRVLERHYWGPGSLQRAPRVRLGAPGFFLRFRDGYATGIVAGAKLGRFQAYGFYCERFERGRWYRFPDRAALALRRLTAHLRPVRVLPAPRSC